MAKVIEVTVSPQGEVTVQTKGYSGPECQAASKALEAALGIASGERKTAEYFAASTAQEGKVQA